MGKRKVEEQEGEDSSSPVDETDIEEAAEAVSELIPEDFRPMKVGLPTDAEDGDVVKVVLIGKARGGKLTDIYGAECDYGDREKMQEDKSKGRIKVMVMGGEEEEE